MPRQDISAALIARDGGKTSLGPVSLFEGGAEPPLAEMLGNVPPGNIHRCIGNAAGLAGHLVAAQVDGIFTITRIDGTEPQDEVPVICQLISRLRAGESSVGFGDVWGLRLDSGQVMLSPAALRAVNAFMARHTPLPAHLTAE